MTTTKTRALVLFRIEMIDFFLEAMRNNEMFGAAEVSDDFSCHKMGSVKKKRRTKLWGSYIRKQHIMF